MNNFNMSLNGVLVATEHVAARCINKVNYARVVLNGGTMCGKEQHQSQNVIVGNDVFRNAFTEMLYIYLKLSIT